MKVLYLCYNMLAQGFYEWALREMHPLHPDVPHIMWRLVELRDRAQILLG